MSYYVISYDLHKERSYQPVWDLLGMWGAVKLLESVWLVESSSGAGALREALQKAGDKDDSFAVLELQVQSNWSTIRVNQEGVAFLSSKIRNYQ